MTCLTKSNIKLINFGPPGERNKDGIDLVPYNRVRNSSVMLSNKCI